MSLFETGVRPAIDAWLVEESKKKRDYGDYWSASSAGYCMRRVIFDRLGVPHTKEDARKQRVFTSGHLFHEWIQGITKEAGLSIAQELELQDEELMIRGHIDDLVLVHESNLKTIAETVGSGDDKYDRTRTVDVGGNRLILYDYKTVNSRSFMWAKKNGNAMSFFHEMQLGTYMYMLRQLLAEKTKPAELDGHKELVEGRILKIEKDALMMGEQQLLWTDELSSKVRDYWTTLNKLWTDKKLPGCTCADKENGFMAKEAYNPYFYNGEPCSLDWLTLKKQEGVITW